MHFHVLPLKKTVFHTNSNEVLQIINILNIKFQEAGITFNFLCVAEILTIYGLEITV